MQALSTSKFSALSPLLGTTCLGASPAASGLAAPLAASAGLPAQGARESVLLPPVTPSGIPAVPDGGSFAVGKIGCLQFKDLKRSDPPATALLSDDRTAAGHSSSVRSASPDTDSHQDLVLQKRRLSAHSSIRTRPANSETKETTKVKISTDEEGNKVVNQYVIIRKLGGGSYGKVKLCMNSEDNELYAMKICYKSMLRKRRQGMGTALDDVMREIAIMRRLNHGNVVKLYEVINDPSEDRLFLVMEYMENGAVQRDSRNLEALPEATVRKYLRDVVCGLEYLHGQRVIHRDLKPENLLVAHDGTVKISDFGVSHAFAGDDDTLQQSAGSPAFLAPELCAAGTVPHGRAVDVWALGVTVYCLLFGKVPWMADNVLEIYERIRNDPLVLPRPVGADLEDFLRRVLEKDPAKRLTLAEIRAHPWFNAAV